MSAPDPVPEVTVPFFKEHSELRSASYSPDSRWLGVVTLDGRVYVLDAARWSAARPVELAKGAGEPPPLAWNPDSRSFAVAAADNVVGVYSIEQGATEGADPKVSRLSELRGHTGRITSISFKPTTGEPLAPNEDRLLTTSEDRTARLWKLGPNQRLLEGLVLRGHRDTVGSAVFTSNGDELITASEDGTLRRWTPLFTLREQPVDALQAASFSDDGQRIWAVGRDRLLELAPLGASERVTTSITIPEKAWTMLSDFHGPKLIASESTGVTITDAREPIKTRLLENSNGFGLASTSPGGRFAVLAKDGERRQSPAIQLWDLTALHASSPTAPRSTKGPCAFHAVSRNGDRLVWYCADDDRIAITASRTAATKLGDALEKVVTRIQFSNDGRLLAVAFDDFSAQIVDSATLKSLTAMVGHTGSIVWSDFSRDGRFLATISRDATARVWDVVSGEPVARLDVTDRGLRSVAFSPDGFSLLLQASSGLLLWRCYACGDSDAILAEIKRRQVSRPLSHKEEDRLGLTSAELHSEEAETPDRHR